MIANISSSVMTADQNRTDNVFTRNANLINSCHPISSLRNNSSLKCAKPVLICIVSTLLPVTITLLLIIGFIMQKSNLHEYAIYTFVIFCLAFIFPFVLFFIIVVLNKMFKLYKRLTNTSDSVNGVPNRMSRHSHLRFNESDVRHSYHICNNFSNDSNNFYINNLSLINVSVSQEIPLDDEPPSYEMALLCPSVQLSDRNVIDSKDKQNPT